MYEGCVLTATGNAAEAIEMLTSGAIEYRSTGSSIILWWMLSHLAASYSDLGEWDEALRCIGEVMTAVERIEALREPAVKRREKTASLIPLSLIAPEPRHAHGSAEFPGLCLLLPSRERQPSISASATRQSSTSGWGRSRSEPANSW